MRYARTLRALGMTNVILNTPTVILNEVKNLKKYNI